MKQLKQQLRELEKELKKYQKGSDRSLYAVQRAQRLGRQAEEIRLELLNR
jgi:AAA+ ATPase superfamily predicted ATPase